MRHIFQMFYLSYTNNKPPINTLKLGNPPFISVSVNANKLLSPWLEYIQRWGSKLFQTLLDTYKNTSK